MAAMWRYLPLLLAAACNTPGPPGQYRLYQTVEVEGSRFRVYHDARTAVAIRTNLDLAPRTATIFPRAESAILQATGCRIIPGTMQGDPALIHADIVC
ncbi:hypothetical protein DDZ14_18060 [Maritimibacter sp. 55A14]|uniref:hypothetical protein n=1 Tax=Maritimibacter sp. 55A14 TaxID=2174844 RepID=UPI000D618765|nr:hypothetical protein [Maritimibacter sp. 55A14]PWE28888.1 hypothetical protein DDZ14_18060 [Maritimibacter sp. 55A14]